MAISMFDLMRELKEIESVLEENGGELTPELDEIITINRNEAKEKISRTAALIALINKDTLSLKEQEQRAKRKQKSNEALVKRLSQMVTDATMAYGTKSKTKAGFTTYKFEATETNANISSGHSLEINNVEEVPAKYKTVTHTIPEISEKDFPKFKELLVQLTAEGTEIRSEEVVDIDKPKLKADLMEEFKNKRAKQEYEEQNGIEADTIEEFEEKVPYAAIKESFNLKFT